MESENAGLNFEASSFLPDSSGTRTTSRNISQKELLTVTPEMLDQIRLAQHHLIAKKLLQDPEATLALAQRDLQRDIGQRLAPATYLWCEWRMILEQSSIDRIVLS
jgi:hypothetical protein